MPALHDAHASSNETSMSSRAEMYEDALRDEWYAQLYEEHAGQALNEFRVERLASYYAAHLEMAVPAYAVLEDARAVRPLSPASALVRATTASELGIKNLLLRPIVYGLVHNDSFAGVISSLVMSHQAVDRYRDLLVGILRDYGGVDLNTYSRPHAQALLWDELARLQGLRNKVIHQGLTPPPRDSDAAIAVAGTVLELLFPEVTGRLGFHLHAATLCADPHIDEHVAELLTRLAP